MRAVWPYLCQNVIFLKSKQNHTHLKISHKTCLLSICNNNIFTSFAVSVHVPALFICHPRFFNIPQWAHVPCKCLLSEPSACCNPDNSLHHCVAFLLDMLDMYIYNAMKPQAEVTGWKKYLLVSKVWMKDYVLGMNYHMMNLGMSMWPEGSTSWVLLLLDHRHVVRCWVNQFSASFLSHYHSW